MGKSPEQERNARPTRRSADIALTWRGKEDISYEAILTRRPTSFVATEVYAANAQNTTRRRPSSRLEHPPGSLYFGDNLAVLLALRATHAHSIDLIYIDPPFCTGNQFPLQTVVSDHETRQVVHRIEAYSDRWEDGIAGYLTWLYPRLRLMHDLLAPTGSLVLHIDWRAASHVRLLLDEIFGPEQLLNEIVWYKGFRGTRARSIFQHAHDILWWYAKGPHDPYWEQDFEPYKDREMKRYNRVDENGRRYARIKRRRTDGTIYYGKTYPGATGKWRNDVIADIPTMAATSSERTGFATQKPLRLLEVLVKSLSPPGGLVADFFCGTGTTLRAAGKLGRRFLGCDEAPIALHLARRELLRAEVALDFTVYRAADGARPAFREAEAGLLRREGSALTLAHGGPGGAFLDFWAVDPHPAGTVFRPAWYALAPGKQPLCRQSPPLAAHVAGDRMNVLLAHRDGREEWLTA